MSTLSPWLQLMLAEITRKQEDLERARAETDHRSREQAPVQPPANAQVRGTQR
jgi:hypothetical protein